MPHGLIARYTRWLHTGWPAGRVEKLPLVREDGSTSVPGLYVTGDLTGVPLLKFSSHTGASVIGTILADPDFARRGRGPAPGGQPVRDLVIIGAGVSGMAAAMEARRAGLDFEILEASEPFSTLVNFPRGKPIYTYPSGMTPAGQLQFTARSAVKEGLVEEMRELMEQHRIVARRARAVRVVRRGRLLEVEIHDDEPLIAHRVVAAIGRSGDFRRLGVPGEDLDKVFNRLHDPKDFAGREVLVVGGGDSAAEAAAALAGAGARVTLAHRGASLSRPKAENAEAIERLSRPGGPLRLALSSKVAAIRPREVVLESAGTARETIPNDAVFTLIGREAPLDFFRRSGVAIRGDWGASTWAGFAAFLLLCTFLYNWKAGGALTRLFQERSWFPFNVPGVLAAWGDPSSLAGTLKLSLGAPGFYYSLAYTVCVTLFGVARIRRRRTPYITAQTLVLMAVQIVPLFLLPYVALPWAGHNGWFDSGAGAWLGDSLFPPTEWDPHGREYWRAFGLVLAWPLFIWNVFTAQPLWAWLAISFAQTFVLIPLMIFLWGKGSYCGWICSCGALAETLGDTQRHKMPHGPFWNRLNMVGQGVLVLALALLATRAAGWAWPDGWAARMHAGLLNGWSLRAAGWNVQLNYYWWVDVMLAGIVGVGCYFWLSGRVWCRFACPLAALMHVYARWSRFRILSEKKKCISCNVCTSVCHQGIDVMSFANKGEPMADPECVRCSACVQACPTGTLRFGRIDPASGRLLAIDRLGASPVLMREAAA
ncbi:MAG TPA: NAD(P)-binding domain-containing protein, partial [Candidatus Polarisedimenticolia bacterium]|nr:NAD(P)-binding domain-containing protein [Candidatus Polarisedimenticolia bacterium]